MQSVVFVAPFFAETTLRFVSAVSGLEGVAATLVTQEPASGLPKRLRERLSGHLQVDDAIDPRTILKAVQAVRRRTGQPVERLIGTLEELQVPLGQVRDELGIFGMGAEAGKNFRDKARMKSVLRAHGLPCARHALAHTPEEAVAFVESVGYPVIVKPQAGSGSRGTHRLSGPDDLAGCLRSMTPSPQRPLVFEEFIVGEEHSFDCITLGGRPVWYSINDYLPGALDVVREPWIQWCVLLPREVDDHVTTPSGASLRTPSPRSAWTRA